MKQHQNVKALRELRRMMDSDGIDVLTEIDWAIRVCEAADALVNVKGRHHSERAYRRLEEAVNGDSGAEALSTQG